MKRPVAFDHTHENSTQTYDGFQSKTDKGNLDALVLRKPAYDALIDAVSEPTGFTNNANIGVSYDPTTRKVTLSGTFEAFYKGVKIPVLKDGWVSEAHADVAGTYYLYYCATGFVFDTTPWDFACLHIAFIQYNAHDIGIREVHGFMPNTVHDELHRTIGSFKRSGGDFTGYVLNSTVAAERRPDVSDTAVQDEDLTSTVLALSTKLYTQRYLTGSAVRSFTTGASDIVPLSGSQPYWNKNTVGTWSQELFSNNSYGAIFVVALPTTADAGSQAFRYMFVQPQKNSASLAEIQALTPNDLTHGDMVSEFVFIGKIIIRYTGGNWSITQVDKIDGTRNSQVTTPAGNYLSIVSHDATLSGEGTAGSPLSVVNDGHTHDGRYYTESEITTLLSRKQDTLVSGTNIKTINGASVLGSGDLSVSADVFYKQNDEPFSNIISNGDFASVTGWVSAHFSLSVLSNELVASVTALSSSSSIYQDLRSVLTIGNKYYLRCQFKPKYATLTRFYIGDAYGVSRTPIANEWNTFSEVLTNVAETTAAPRLYHSTGTNYALSDTVWIKNFQVIDLTAQYGAGNEPTQEAMDAYVKKLWLDTNDNTLNFFDGGGWKLLKDTTKVAKAGDTMTGNLIMGTGAGLLGSNVLGELQRIWAYGSSYTGFGIYYNDGSPDELRFDVSGQAASGTPDFVVKPNLAQVNGQNVIVETDRGGTTIGGGYYIKYSDGTIFQFARITFSSDSSTAMSGGGGFKSANQTWTFPLAFTSADSYAVSVTPEGMYQIAASVQARSSTALTYCTHTVSSDATSRSRTVLILAIGR
jgi:hypothetical protein